MYSLYRAWFGAEESYPSLESLSPPDTLVRVGNDGQHQFVAHRGVLAAHSGYLKALLTSSAARNVRDETTSPVTSVSVSSVGGEAFAPLLNYMYTGRLEVTLENIYSVLLATHLLHMPGALEECRAALLRLRGPPPPPLPANPAPTPTPRPGTIIRPVANRLIGPPLCWPQPSIYAPGGHVALSSHHLPNFQLTSGLSILPPPPNVHQSTDSALSYSYREKSPSPVPQASSSSSITQAGRVSERPKSGEIESNERVSEEREDVRIMDEDSSSKEENEIISVVEKGTSPARSIGEPNTISSGETCEESARRRLESPRIGPGASGSPSNGVIFDIACCDGPVRFHRVLNENYVSTGSDQQQPQQRPRTGNRSVEEAGSARTSLVNDENGKPDSNSGSEAQTPSDRPQTGSYACTYCRHTFKSHYCYRKHARRHLLPTGENRPANVPVPIVERPEQTRPREVKLLDLNVQYYPCKICGSKFPSYYFVHKHKKLCHANSPEDGAPRIHENTENPSAQPPTSSTSNP